MEEAIIRETLQSTNDVDRNWFWIALLLGQRNGMQLKKRCFKKNNIVKKISAKMTRHGCSEFSEQLVIIDCLGKSFYNGNDSFSVNACFHDAQISRNIFSFSSQGISLTIITF